VHDLLDQDGGAERVVSALHDIFPDAPIFTALWDQQAMPQCAEWDVRTSWLQAMPGIQRAPRAYAALYPLVFAGLDLSEFDLVISSDIGFAKGVRTAKGALHVCYCHSPSNFVWRPRAYVTSRRSRMLAAPLRAWLRAWDLRAAARPAVFIANSDAVAGRIRAFYGRDASVIAPSIEQSWFVPHEANDFYLVVCRLVEPKRVDLAVQACSRLGVPLLIVGIGRAEARLRALAGPRVRFEGRVSDDRLRTLYSHARAVLVPAEEDFGLVPAEAQAAGTPVIAYDAGGARETVIDGITGVRFAPQTVEALVAAIERFEQQRWDPSQIQANAARFTKDRFQRDLLALIKSYRSAHASVGSSLDTAFTERSPAAAGTEADLRT
jgi:glycosyltransferase involved in cell wall biosynthesis